MPNANRYLFPFFPVWIARVSFSCLLLWLECAVVCWVEAEKMGILASFLTLEEKLSAFLH